MFFFHVIFLIYKRDVIPVESYQKDNQLLRQEKIYSLKKVNFSKLFKCLKLLPAGNEANAVLSEKGNPAFFVQPAHGPFEFFLTHGKGGLNLFGPAFIVAGACAPVGLKQVQDFLGRSLH